MLSLDPALRPSAAEALALLEQPSAAAAEGLATPRKSRGSCSSGGSTRCSTTPSTSRRAASRNSGRSVWARLYADAQRRAARRSL